MFKSIVVKVGTNVITREDGLLDMTSISHIVDQLAELKSRGIEVILVSSGAVGAGRSLLPNTDHLAPVVMRQMLSAIGQVRLMEVYRQLFHNHGLFCAQVLATKEDFRDRQHYINMQNCFRALLRDRVVPVVNENDVVAVTELMFTDNDELAGLVAAMSNADALVILSSVDGLFDGPPDDPASQVVAEVGPEDKAWLQSILPSRSSFGRGGMHTKFRIAQKAAKVGITTHIANGRHPNILIALADGQHLGTRFRAREKLSSVKKWMAYHELEQKGTVYINAGAEKELRSAEKVTSLLPIGITAIEGDFVKGDLIRISNQQREPIGVGVARYGADTAQSYVGKKGKKALVHYDYLFIG